MSDAEHASARLLSAKRSPGSLEWKSKNRASQAWSGAEPYHQDLRFFSVFRAAFCSPRGPSTTTTRLQGSGFCPHPAGKNVWFYQTIPRRSWELSWLSQGGRMTPPPTPQEAVPVARRWNVWSELTLRSHVNHRVGKQFNLSVCVWGCWVQTVRGHLTLHLRRGWCGWERGGWGTCHRRDVVWDPDMKNLERHAENLQTLKKEVVKANPSRKPDGHIRVKE